MHMYIKKILIKKLIFYDSDENETRLPFYKSFSTFGNVFDGLCTQFFYLLAQIFFILTDNTFAY